MKSLDSELGETCTTCSRELARSSPTPGRLIQQAGGARECVFLTSLWVMLMMLAGEHTQNPCSTTALGRLELQPVFVPLGAVEHLLSAGQLGTSLPRFGQGPRSAELLQCHKTPPGGRMELFPHPPTLPAVLRGASGTFRLKGQSKAFRLERCLRGELAQSSLKKKVKNIVPDTCCPAPAGRPVMGISLSHSCSYTRPSGHCFSRTVSWGLPLETPRSKGPDPSPVHVH